MFKKLKKLSMENGTSMVGDWRDSLFTCVVPMRELLKVHEKNRIKR